MRAVSALLLVAVAALDVSRVQAADCDTSAFESCVTASPACGKPDCVCSELAVQTACYQSYCPEPSLLSSFMSQASLAGALASCVDIQMSVGIITPTPPTPSSSDTTVTTGSGAISSPTATSASASEISSTSTGSKSESGTTVPITSPSSSAASSSADSSSAPSSSGPITSSPASGASTSRGAVSTSATTTSAASIGQICASLWVLTSLSVLFSML